MNWSVIIITAFLLMGNKQLLPADIVKITVPDMVVHPGEDTVIKIRIEIKQGYHIQANKLKDDFLIPTTLKIIAYKNIKTGVPQFPPSKIFKLEDTDIFLDVYDGAFDIKIPVTIEKEISKTSHTLNANLQYQACDNKTCLFPRIIAFSFVLNVV